MASTTGTWQDRQVILIKGLLLIAKIDSNVVSETIPLQEISRVTAITGHVEKMMQESSQTSFTAAQTAAAAAPKGTFAFQIFMHESAAVGARSYSFRTDTKQDCDDWVKYITTVSAVAVRAHQATDPSVDKVLRWRMRCKQFYKSQPVQV
jgi:hypothetical protein